MKKCRFCDDNSNLSLKKVGIKVLSCCENHYEQYKKEVYEKKKNTYLKKYGVENISQLDEIKEKKKETCLKHFGFTCANKSASIQNNRKLTCLEKYGVEHPSQLDEIKEKQKETCLKHFGVEYPGQSDIIKEKNKNTCLEKYGVEYSLQSKKVRKKGNDTIFLKYGKESTNQLEIIKNKKRNTYKNNYWDTFLIKLKNKYIITLFDKEYYMNNDKDFKFKCLKCNNEFISDKTNPQKIYCKKCDTSKSDAEYEIEYWLKSLNLNLKIERNKWIYFNTKEVKRREIDILVNNKLAIFHHGIAWHSTKFKKDKNFHQQLFNLFTEKGYIPIQIFENEWKLKTDIVKSIILSKLNINQTKIYARKTIIKEIDNKSYKLFLEENNIQGYINSKIKLGMFLDNKLISVLGLGKSRFKKNETEIIRYCSLLNYQITGGLAKFLTHIKNNYQFENIISYIDLRYFDGGSYLNNGFKLESITKPNYYYFKNGYNLPILYNHIQFQKHKLKNKLNKFDPNLTEYENMLNNGYLRIFDAGNYKLKLISKLHKI